MQRRELRGRAQDSLLRRLAKGLVNSREHLESLLVAEETGYASLQQYLGAVGATAPAQQADAVIAVEAR